MDLKEKLLLNKATGRREDWSLSLNLETRIIALCFSSILVSKLRERKRKTHLARILDPDGAPINREFSSVESMGATK